MRREEVGRKRCTPSILVRLHMVYDAQMFLTSFQYVLVARQKQSGYEEKRPLKMGHGAAAWLTKNKKNYMKRSICFNEKLFPLNS